MKQKKQRKPKLTEEEKRKKFGDNYDPDYRKKSNSAKSEDFTERDKQDIEWYAITDQIAKDIASLSYGNLTGAPTDIDIVSQGSVKKIQSWYASNVGIIEFDLAQLADPSALSGLTMAANQLYQYLRHTNSGARNYEPADCIMLILAMRQVYLSFCEIKRAIGVARYYEFKNRNFPDRMLQALNVDPNDLRKNIQQYRGQLNLLAERINSFAIPAYFKAFYRAIFVSSNVFADSSSPRGQFYAYNSRGMYQWSPISNPSGTELVYYTKEQMGIPASGATLQNYFDAVDQLLTAISQDSDANTIMGDVLNGFKKANLIVLDQTPETYIVIPQFHETALAQIENMVGLSAYLDGARADSAMQPVRMNVTQTNGLLSWRPQILDMFGANTYAAPRELVLNSHKEEPDYKDNLEWTRLMNVWSFQQKQDGYYDLELSTAGFEMIYGMVMHPSDLLGEVYVTQSYTLNSNVGIDGIMSLAAFEQFDWHPTLYVFSQNGENGSVERFNVIADLKVYTWVSQPVLAKINDCVVSAGFYAKDLYDSLQASSK